MVEKKSRSDNADSDDLTFLKTVLFYLAILDLQPQQENKKCPI